MVLAKVVSFCPHKPLPPSYFPLRGWLDEGPFFFFYPPPLFLHHVDPPVTNPFSPSPCKIMNFGNFAQSHCLCGSCVLARLKGLFFFQVRLAPPFFSRLALSPAGFFSPPFS